MSGGRLSSVKPATILFAGGGTGGHLFPALAIAEQVLERSPQTKVRFLCSDRPLDARILAEERLLGAPVDFHPIRARPFGVRPFAAVKFLSAWGGAVRSGRAAIRRAAADGPVCVVAGGGFVAAPVVQAARAEKTPVLMLNLDAAPGLANRWISKRADQIVTTAPVRGYRWEMIPPIVRRAAVALGSREDCRGTLGLDRNRPTLFVTGASQGAQSITQLCTALARSPELKGWQVIHQTGKPDVGAVEAAYREAGVPALVFGFRKDLGVCWGAADLAISRAGAGSVGEAWANAVPTVFLPYPYHKDQHQKLNAQPLVETGGAVLADDRVGVEANVRTVGPLVLTLLRDAVQRDTMRAALAKLGPADGAARVAGMLV